MERASRTWVHDLRLDSLAGTLDVLARGFEISLRSLKFRNKALAIVMRWWRLGVKLGFELGDLGVLLEFVRRSSFQYSICRLLSMMMICEKLLLETQGEKGSRRTMNVRASSFLGVHVVASTLVGFLELLPRRFECSFRLTRAVQKVIRVSMPVPRPCLCESGIRVDQRGDCGVVLVHCVGCALVRRSKRSVHDKTHLLRRKQRLSRSREIPPQSASRERADVWVAHPRRRPIERRKRLRRGVAFLYRNSVRPARKR